jgi:hypothetical protein
MDDFTRTIDSDSESVDHNSRVSENQDNAGTVLDPQFTFDFTPEDEVFSNRTPNTERVVLVGSFSSILYIHILDNS